MWLIGYPGWLLRCYYTVSKITGVVAKLLLWYLGWLLRCCYALSREPRVVVKVLLYGC